MSSPDRGHRPDAEPVRLGPSTADLVSLLLLAAVVGMGTGLALPWVAAWVEDLPWVPFQGPLELVASMPWGWATVVGCGAGLVLGVALAVVTIRDALGVTVGSDSVTIERGGVTQRLDRADVIAVFLDGKRLVVVDGASREVLCDEVDAKPGRIEGAFRQHGYPWHQVDPFSDAFQPWVRETPDLSGSVNAIFAARETSLLAKDVEDAGDLRSELLKKGFVVRDREARQYWRPLEDEPDPRSGGVAG